MKGTITDITGYWCKVKAQYLPLWDIYCRLKMSAPKPVFGQKAECLNFWVDWTSTLRESISVSARVYQSSVIPRVYECVGKYIEYILEYILRQLSAKALDTTCTSRRVTRLHHWPEPIKSQGLMYKPDENILIYRIGIHYPEHLRNKGECKFVKCYTGSHNYQAPQRLILHRILTLECSAVAELEQAKSC